MDFENEISISNVQTNLFHLFAIILCQHTCCWLVSYANLYISTQFTDYIVTDEDEEEAKFEYKKEKKNVSNLNEY